MTQRAAVEYRQRTVRKRRNTWLIVLGIAGLSLTAVIYVLWARLRSAFDLLVEATGSSEAAGATIVVGLVALLALLLWMSFPLLVFFGFRNLSRRTAELEQTTRLCVRHLARLTAKNDSPPNEGGTGPLPP